MSTPTLVNGSDVPRTLRLHTSLNESGQLTGRWEGAASGDELLDAQAEMVRAAAAEAGTAAYSPTGDTADAVAETAYTRAIAHLARADEAVQACEVELGARRDALQAGPAQRSASALALPAIGAGVAVAACVGASALSRLAMALHPLAAVALAGAGAACVAVLPVAALVANAHREERSTTPQLASWAGLIAGAGLITATFGARGALGLDAALVFGGGVSGALGFLLLVVETRRPSLLASREADEARAPLTEAVLVAQAQLNAARAERSRWELAIGAHREELQAREKQVCAAERHEEAAANAIRAGQLAGRAWADAQLEGRFPGGLPTRAAMLERHLGRGATLRPPHRLT